MSDRIEISFVIPAYNEQLLLARTLRSITNEIDRCRCTSEIIVVNNGSTDMTFQIAKSFENIRVIEEPEKGLTKCRKAGFLVARGKLIANIDADTVLPEGWLSVVLEEFSSDPSVVGLSGPNVYYDASRLARLAVRLFYLGGYCFHILNQLVFRVGAMLQGGNFVVTREAVVRINGFNSDFEFYGEDTDMACRLIAVGKVKFSFRLWAFSSGRRLNKEGLVHTGLQYALNFFWATFFRKPFTRSWTDIR